MSRHAELGSASINLSISDVNLWIPKQVRDEDEISMNQSHDLKQNILKQFQTIPGVGKSIAADLWDLGFRSIDELKDKDPQKMYDDFCELKGMKIDRCMLYTFRCAVYFVSNKTHKPHLLKWWNWKDMI